MQSERERTLGMGNDKISFPKPQRLKMIELAHSSAVAAHAGPRKTQPLIAMHGQGWAKILKTTADPAPSVSELLGMTLEHLPTTLYQFYVSLSAKLPWTLA